MNIYSGGDGLTKEYPVVIDAETSFIGIPAEYMYIAQIHGNPKAGDWSLKSQMLLATENGGHMDQLNIVLKDGIEISYFFDITKFFGKF